MNEKFDYIEEANVTMSDGFHTEKVSHELLLSCITHAIDILNDLDAMKKALFYGRDLPIGLDVADKGMRKNDIQITSLHDNPHDGIRLLHGIIGHATEAGELLFALREALMGRTIDPTNIAEEVGDSQWYEAAILRVLGTNFERVQRTNIAKLRTRFPDKFNEHDANNRNLQKERVVLEGKPIVDIKDWCIVGNRLFGRALNHPRAPGGGESDVATSAILQRHGDQVETRNTIYKLIGPPVER